GKASVGESSERPCDESRNMQPLVRRKVQSAEFGQPRPRERGQVPHLTMVAKQHMPVDDAIPRGRLGSIRPVVHHPFRRRAVHQPSLALGSLPGSAAALNSRTFCCSSCAGLLSRYRAPPNCRSTALVYAVTVAIRSSGSRVNTGSTSATAASSAPSLRCTIAAPIRTCAQFAATRGSPLAQPSSAKLTARSAPARSRVWLATDSAKPACRPRANDHADTPESATVSASRSARPIASRARPTSPNSAAALASCAASCTRTGASGLRSYPRRAISADSNSLFCQRYVLASAVQASASFEPASSAYLSPAMPYP